MERGGGRVGGRVRRELRVKGEQARLRLLESIRDIGLRHKTLVDEARIMTRVAGHKLPSLLVVDAGWTPAVRASNVQHIPVMHL